MSDASHPLKWKPSGLDKPRFMALYGNIYEHSPHFAAAVWAQTPHDRLDTVEGLAEALRAVVERATREAQIALLRAHPDLAGKAMVRGMLSTASAKEQAGAGLDQCTEEEFAAFQSLNAAYRDKFGFPFILAARGRHRRDILDAFRRRIENSPEEEFREALQQVHRIALFRLMDLADLELSS